MNFNVLVESKMCSAFDDKLYYFTGSKINGYTRLWRLLEDCERGGENGLLLQDILEELIDNAYAVFSQIELFILLQNTKEFEDWLSDLEDMLFDRLTEDNYELVLGEEALACFPNNCYEIFSLMARQRCQEFFETLATHPITDEKLLQSQAYKACDSRTRFLIKNILVSDKGEDFLTSLAGRHEIDYAHLAGLLMSSPEFELLHIAEGLFCEVDDDLEDTAEDIRDELSTLRSRLLQELNWVDILETEGWLACD